MTTYRLTQNAIDKFSRLFLKEQHRLHQDKYYERLMQRYLQNTVPIKLPVYAQTEKALKYDVKGNGTRKREKEQHLLNKQEQLLFVVVGNIVVTCHYPYAHSKQNQKRQHKYMFKKKRRRTR